MAMAQAQTSKNRSRSRPTNANREALAKQARGNNKTRTSRHSSKKLKGINRVALAMMINTQPNERSKLYSMLKKTKNS